MRDVWTAWSLISTASARAWVGKAAAAAGLLTLSSKCKDWTAKCSENENLSTNVRGRLASSTG